MSHPPSLFDPEVSERRKEEGMAVVDSHAPPTLKMQWLDIVHEICKTHITFWMDHVIKLGQERGLDEPDNNKLFGPIMLDAARRGWCRKTNKVTKTERASMHSGNQQIWASNLTGTQVKTCPHCHGDGVIGLTP